MSETEIILTIISVLGTLSSIMFGYLAFRRADKKEDKLAGRNEGILISDLGYIKSSTERIEKRLDKLEHNNSDIGSRVLLLENEVKYLKTRKIQTKEVR